MLQRFMKEGMIVNKRICSGCGISEQLKETDGWLVLNEFIRKGKRRWA